jgi:hypothetical protein
MGRGTDLSRPPISSADRVVNLIDLISTIRYVVVI